MQDIPPVRSAWDAVRCLYLARVAEREGHADAAERWKEMANDWLDRLEPHNDRSGPSSADAN